MSIYGREGSNPFSATIKEEEMSYLRKVAEQQLTNRQLEIRRRRADAQRFVRAMTRRKRATARQIAEAAAAAKLLEESQKALEATGVKSEQTQNVG